MVIIKLQGSFTNKSAAVDGWTVLLSGTSTTFTGKVSLPQGEHRLEWAVQGMPGATYTVAISGDTADWSRADLLIGDDGYGYGFHRFKVSPS